ncbi:hypothetical protein C8A00DRAFT_43548 [Chaetomidium leptoderma]|uniref:DUF6546 domain-containing protein n=1 Tax=Chaetomidium leptoderma TaxID=669021 RepID=A0AAN6VLW6_9PEZI|nr:hypothetical protein C8A00DRAFT_43548 [Chaetomidium leptoderma]
MADGYRVPIRRHGVILRGSTMAKSRPWASLPAEIRLKILEEIAQQKHAGWASLASVCKEWQFVIAKENFRQLKLRPSCLDDFERLIVRQRHLIRHIQLEIELPRYSCQHCKRHASMRSIDQENLFISRGIWKLFQILGTWESARHRHTAHNGLTNGLTLELNAYSPSDTEHWFKNYHFTSDADGNNDDNRKSDDPVHGWINGQQVVTPPATAIPRLFSMINLPFGKEVPQIGSITRLIIRRQLRRSFHPISLFCILRKLDALEHLVYEPWRQWENGLREMQDRCFLRFVEYLPKTLKKLSVFEDFSDSIAAVLVEDQNKSQNFRSMQMQVEAVRVVDPRIGAAFASRSLDLEQLSVSYMVNAEDFLGACLQSWTWPRLESLALTSRLLHDDWECREDVDTLLYGAGMAALRMPKLRTLAIWNGRAGNACAFIYHTDGNYAYVTWRGTWEMDLSPRVVEVWERVALESRSCPLRVTKQQVQGVIGSHGDAIHRLALPCPVVAPESLWQIRREGR